METVGGGGRISAEPTSPLRSSQREVSPTRQRGLDKERGDTHVAPLDLSHPVWCDTWAGSTLRKRPAVWGGNFFLGGADLLGSQPEDQATFSRRFYQPSSWYFDRLQSESQRSVPHTPVTLGCI